MCGPLTRCVSVSAAGEHALPGEAGPAGGEGGKQEEAAAPLPLPGHHGLRQPAAQRQVRLRSVSCQPAATQADARHCDAST